MKNRMPPTHPGEILRDEIEARGLSVHALAMALRVPASRLAEIAAGRRGISADTALRLARALGTSAEFWLNLQSAYDLRVAERENGRTVAREVTRIAA